MRPLPFPLRILTALLATTLPAVAATINVSPPQKIQDAIDAASVGDTILVAPGTYFENIDFEGKAITVTSTQSLDPATIKAATAATIVDGGGNAPTVRFHSSEPNTAILSYLTIQNGGAPDTSGTDFNYGGIYINNAAPTILGNTITHNNCFGISSSSAGPLIENNEISATQTPSTGCGFTNGSGIFISANLTTDGSSATISSNTIENNIEAANSATTQNGGAGIAVYSGSPSILNNTIRNNSAPFATGGGIDVIGGSNVTIAQNLIYSNQAGCGGGAIAFRTEANTQSVLYLLVQNNTIVDNVVPPGAPASGCVIDSQLYPTDGGYSSPIVIFLNNIITGNTSGPATSCYPQQQPSEYNQSIFDHNILYNAGGSFFGQYCIDVSGAYGNLALDPQFTNATASDFHLKTTAGFSPAIDAGNNSTALFSTLYDFDGHARVQDATGKGYPTIDMGAYEASGVADATPTETVVATSTPQAGRPLVITAQVDSPAGTPSGTATFYIDRIKSVDPLNPVTLNNAGTAVFSANLAIGPHSIYAVYSGAGSEFPPSVSVVTVVDIEAVNTSVSIMAAPNPALIGQSILFTVNSSSVDASYSPAPITVYDIDHGYAVLATLTPDASGVATFSDAGLSAGLHTIVAIFAGIANYSSATSAKLPVTVTSPTTLSLISATNPAQADVPFTVTATVSSLDHFPSGFIDFYSDNALIASAAIVDPGNLPPPGSGPPPPHPLDVATSISLSGGTHNLVAKYPGDDNSSNSVSNAVVETVLADPTKVSIAVSPTATTAFQPVGLTAQIVALNSVVPPTGSISFTANGRLLSMAPLDTHGIASITTDFPAGTYSIVASFAANGSFAASSSAAVSEVVAQDASSTTMGVSPNPGYFPGGTENLTATVKPVLPPSAANFAAPSGVITFYDGATSIGTMSATGSSSLVDSSLGVGSHMLTAVYSGDSNYMGSTSGPVPLQILLRDFTLGTDPSIAIQTQHHKNLNVMLNTVGGFTDTIALTCGNLPDFASCNFPGGGTQGAVMLSGDTPLAVDIDTDALLNFESSLLRDKGRGRNPNFRNETLGTIFALLLPVVLFPSRRHIGRGLRAGSLLRLFIVLAAIATMGGCSGRYPGHTAPGTYSITITAKGMATGTAHTVTFTLMVTP